MLPIVMTIGDEDDRAFVDKIYRLYGKKIYLSALKILNSPEDAEDCLQDVIKTVIDRLEDVIKTVIDRLELFQGAGEEQLIKLLVVCTRNTAIDLYRKKKKRLLNEAEYPVFDDGEAHDTDAATDIPDESAFSDRSLINEENRKRITAMIEELDPIYRDILLLRYRYDMKNGEIAGLLNISESAVKVRYLRAKKLLLKKRGKELDEMRKT